MTTTIIRPVIRQSARHLQVLTSPLALADIAAAKHYDEIPVSGSVLAFSIPKFAVIALSAASDLLDVPPGYAVAIGPDLTVCWNKIAVVAAAIDGRCPCAVCSPDVAAEAAAAQGEAGDQLPIKDEGGLGSSEPLVENAAAGAVDENLESGSPAIEDRAPIQAPATGQPIVDEVSKV